MMEQMELKSFRGSRYEVKNDMNPTGTINIKIIRDEKNQITGVGYMTEEEVTELLSDRS